VGPRLIVDHKICFLQEGAQAFFQWFDFIGLNITIQWSISRYFDKGDYHINHPYRQAIPPLITFNGKFGFAIPVIPAKAGIQKLEQHPCLDSRFRGNDRNGEMMETAGMRGNIKSSNDRCGFCRPVNLPNLFL